jgi:hypothetical protein
MSVTYYLGAGAIAMKILAVVDLSNENRYLRALLWKIAERISHTPLIKTIL